ncbi:MAG TPA: cyclopropane-fatty-acyl-phospholipid synthase family protein, partial [Acidobacteriaceae bacterium]
DPRCTLVFRSPGALETMMVRPTEITLGEAFLANEIDVEGDIFAIFAATEHVFRRPRGRRQDLLETASHAASAIGRWWKDGRRHSVERDRSAISHHYDQPVEFYRPWLGESLVYSCGYFKSADDDLAVAQANKLELICRKLRLSPDDRFLDIGCGWGSLVLHAASNHGVYANGITISREQAAIANARIEEARLTQSCGVELLDYRSAHKRFEAFDKIASVGMFEHVGLKNLPQYFRTVYDMLKPGGVFLNHGIARAEGAGMRDSPGSTRSRFPALQRIPILRSLRHSSFIDKYVFPDGELVTISAALRAAEAAGFEVRDVENLREHYELTLRAWVDGLKRNAGALLKQVSEVTYRTWLLYMAGSAAAFRRGDIAVYQTLLSRPEEGESGLPLTREGWYLSGA